MKFEYDPKKSKTNMQKHGIDFKEAQKLWEDEDMIQLPSRHLLDEPRWLVVGCIEKKHYTAIITYRNDAIRIISVRRSRQKERMLYESQRTR
ncbi:BrnT family toxin [Hydrogenimonas sp.]